MLLPRTYERNAAGEPDKITKEDGSYTRIEYDDAGRVKAERYFDDVDTLLDEVTYLYDLDGNRTQRTSSAGVEDYIYESGSRLTQVLLDGVETQRFEYDENGRVSRVVRDGLDQRLIWDALDRLVRIEDQNFVEEPVEFTYDGQGRRVTADRGSSAQRYVVGPTGNQSLESPHLVHNGAFLTGELVYGGEHALWRYQGDGTLQTRVYLRDAMGSVIGLMDENGQLIESFDYDAFGNVRSPGGEALPEVSLGGDSRFQGMWKDAGTGLYYVRARYYDARTGRFLSRDPAEGQLETPESFYPYVFANGNPYVFEDPTGEFALANLAARGPVAAGISQGSATTAISFLNSLQAARALSAAGTLTVAAVIACAANYGASAALGGRGGICEPSERRKHIVRIQVQGSRVRKKLGRHTLSRVWPNTDRPATVSWGLSALRELRREAGGQLRRQAGVAFTAAESFILKGPRIGGRLPPGKSHYVPGIPGSELRVDVEIKEGVNFVN